MALNKLLARQIKKHLPPELLADESLMRFLQAVDASYNAYEKDKTLADHASRLNEEEYVRINGKMQAEVQGRRHAIKLLKEAIAQMDEQYDPSVIDAHEEDSLNGTLAHLADQVTRRKEMEAELEQRVQQFRSLSENIPGVIFEYEFRKDGSDGYRYISPAMEKLFGIPPADFYTFFRYIHPDDKAEIERIRSQSRNTLAPFYIESRLVIPGKGTYWLSISSSFSYYSTKGTKVFTGIMIDITAQKNLEKDLIKAREQAEQFAKSKDNFLANMSHEIRTPMNAVLGMAGQLAKTNLDDKQRFYLETIYSASENLLVILNDILDLTKIKAGKLGLERLGFRPSEVFARALQVMMHKAEEKGLLLRIGFCDPQLSDVLIGDPYRLNQVLLNLLSNAIKFTAVGSVDLSCRVLEDTGTAQQIGIDVADTGMGMDDSFIENLFEKFTQEYDSVTRKFGGTGLGMSICKELITLMGGDIQVTSKKGVGTTIHLIITLEKGGESDLLSRDNTPVDTDSLKNKKVLVVDDNDMNRLVATTMLENYGTVLFEAANGQEAIDFLRDQSVDIVLMDIQMPVMSGLEASRVIREEISPTLPIIALTANAIRGEKDKCMAAGMNGYLSKPFEESALIKMITGSIPRQEANTLSASPDPALGAVPQAGPLYDLHRIEAIGQGKEAFTNKMIRLFIDQVPAILQELQAAGAKADFQTIHEKAHLLKPILHNFAIDSLYEPIRELDDIALAHTPSARIDALVQTISTVAGEVVAILRQGLNS